MSKDERQAVDVTATLGVPAFEGVTKIVPPHVGGIGSATGGSEAPFHVAQARSITLAKKIGRAWATGFVEQASNDRDSFVRERHSARRARLGSL